MAKGKIVLEIPDSCRDCPMFWQGGIYSCQAKEYTSQEEYMMKAYWLRNNYTGNRPNWCPIIKD